MKQSALIPIEQIEEAIHFIRGERVILDADLARLYGVETRALVQAVKRNLQRFPKDFMFQLSLDEFKFLRSQIVISKSRGGRRYMPYVFTEHGAIMAANVLNSQRAVRMSVFVVRAFVKLREIALGYKELAAAVILKGPAHGQAQPDRPVGRQRPRYRFTSHAFRFTIQPPWQGLSRNQKQTGTQSMESRANM